MIDGLHMARSIKLPVDTTNGLATLVGEIRAQLP
jgi:hypothetical protein